MAGRAALVAAEVAAMLALEEALDAAAELAVLEGRLERAHEHVVCFGGVLLGPAAAAAGCKTTYDQRAVQRRLHSVTASGPRIRLAPASLR